MTKKPKPIVLAVATATLEPMYLCSGVIVDEAGARPCRASYHANPEDWELGKRCAHTRGWRIRNRKPVCGECVARLPS